MSTQTTHEKAQHTPGPWIAIQNQSGELIVGPSDGEGGLDCVIAEVYSGLSSSRYSNAVRMKNALLLASAPALFEACIQAIYAIPTTHGAFDTVRQAIAQATGNGQ